MQVLQQRFTALISANVWYWMQMLFNFKHLTNSKLVSSEVENKEHDEINMLLKEGLKT